ncbi:hypothetical protein D3C74_318000 [compost metagenome]
MLLTANEVQRENAWSAEFYILKELAPLKVGDVIVIQSPLEILVSLESFVKNFSNDSKEQIDKEIKQMLILRGLVNEVEVPQNEFCL